MAKIASWNVNSIKVRLPRLLRFLERERPDIVGLQELKCTEESFPFDEIQSLGYQAAVFGQKTYNGVALLSRNPITEIKKGFNDGVEDPQARLIAGRVGDLVVVDIYAPNGQEVGSPKFTYKLEWYERLGRFLEKHYSPSDRVVVCGDFNIAPEARDVHDPALWQKIHFSESEQKVMRELLARGYYDSLRLVNPSSGLYSWWDYRMLAFPKNNGLRIDLILCNEALKEACAGSRIDREERKGEQPSDHAPVITVFSDY